MEQWEDQGIVLSARPHGENGAVVALLTETHGRHAGYVRGASSKKTRGALEPGSLVGVSWRARTHEELGSYTLEQDYNYSSALFHDPLKLDALLSACALCDAALPEREGHAGLFHGLRALFESFDGPYWGAVYVMWEIALLKELGFALALDRCAGGGDSDDLAYVSPKTGRAVSRAAGEVYKEKLLPLPAFLTPAKGPAPDEEVRKGLALTGYFWAHWVFAQATNGVPAARQQLQARFDKAGEN